MLLSMGKEHLYVWEKQSGMLHEDEAAQRLRALCQNEHMHPTPVKEGKIELIADCDGLFQVDVERLNAINGEDEIMIATRHTNTAVHKGDKLAGTRIIPLVIAEDKLKAVEDRAGTPDHHRQRGGQGPHSGQLYSRHHPEAGRLRYGGHPPLSAGG